VSPADFTGGPPVYRFDVTGATDQLPTVYPNQLVVPPLIVQGSVNGTTWITFGTLIPRTEPVISAGPPATLTLGPATFWWENPAGQPAYQQLRVALGPNRAPTRFTLSTLPAPQDPTNIIGPQVTATSSNGNAQPVESGVDQAPLSVQVLDGNSNPSPDTGPSYQRIHYRNSTTNALITNLLLAGASLNSFLGVSPHRRRLPEQRIGHQRPTRNLRRLPLPVHHQHHLAIGHWLYCGRDIAQPTDPGARLRDRPNDERDLRRRRHLPNRYADFTASSLCRLYPVSPGQPATYLDTSSGVQIGILTAALATTSAASLPLQQSTGTPEHLLASAPLTVSATVATLTDTSAFLLADHVDTIVVTCGLPVPAVNIPMGADVSLVRRTGRA
jgi:hypothetical protein